MSEFTPGPWKVYMGDYDGQRAAVIAHAEDMLVVARCPPFEAANKTVEANAMLIAAAPELLEALIRVGIRPAIWGADLQEFIDTTIARATGG